MKLTSDRNKNKFTAAILLSTLILYSCNKPAKTVQPSLETGSDDAASASPSQSKNAAGLAKLTAIDLTNSSIDDLDRLIGNADDISGDAHRYKIGACTLVVYAHSNHINSFSPPSEKSCSMDLSRYFWPSELNVEAGFTVDQFIHAVNPAAFSFSSDCIICSNGMHHDPFIQVHSFGGHIIDNIEFLVSGNLDSASIPEEQWGQKLGMDENSVENTNLTCRQDFQNLAAKLTRPVKLDQVIIGRRIHVDEEGACKGKVPTAEI